jgi:hypothetical protein
MGQDGGAGGKLFGGYKQHRSVRAEACVLDSGGLGAGRPDPEWLQLKKGRPWSCVQSPPAFLCPQGRHERRVLCLKCTLRLLDILNVSRKSMVTPLVFESGQLWFMYPRRPPSLGALDVRSTVRTL